MLIIDKDNGNTLWADIIQQEMNNILALLEDGKEVPHAHRHINCHMMFDISQDGELLLQGQICGWRSRNGKTYGCNACEHGQWRNGKSHTCHCCTK
jgi:hypothetical protein